MAQANPARGEKLIKLFEQIDFFSVLAPVNAFRKDVLYRLRRRMAHAPANKANNPPAAGSGTAVKSTITLTS